MSYSVFTDNLNVNWLCAKHFKWKKNVYIFIISLVYTDRCIQQVTPTFVTEELQIGL